MKISKAAYEFLASHGYKFKIVREAADMNFVPAIKHEGWPWHPDWTYEDQIKFMLDHKEDHHLLEKEEIDISFICW